MACATALARYEVRAGLRQILAFSPDFLLRADFARGCTAVRLAALR